MGALSAFRMKRNAVWEAEEGTSAKETSMPTDKTIHEKRIFLKTVMFF